LKLDKKKEDRANLVKQNLNAQLMYNIYKYAILPMKRTHNHMNDYLITHSSPKQTNKYFELKSHLKTGEDEKISLFKYLRLSTVCCWIKS